MNTETQKPVGKSIFYDCDYVEKQATSKNVPKKTRKKISFIQNKLFKRERADDKYTCLTKREISNPVLTNTTYKNIDNLPTPDNNLCGTKVVHNNCTESNKDSYVHKEKKPNVATTNNMNQSNLININKVDIDDAYPSEDYFIAQQVKQDFCNSSHKKSIAMLETSSKDLLNNPEVNTAENISENINIGRNKLLQDIITFKQNKTLKKVNKDEIKNNKKNDMQITIEKAINNRRKFIISEEISEYDYSRMNSFS